MNSASGFYRIIRRGWYSEVQSVPYVDLSVPGDANRQMSVVRMRQNLLKELGELQALRKSANRPGFKVRNFG
jgi:hypothetical protein